MPGTAPFDAPDVPEGGGMHGGLHRAELATVLVMQGGPFRRGARCAPSGADLTDIAPTVLYLLGVATEGMEGRPLLGALDPAADVMPIEERHAWPGDFVLEVIRSETGRLYPTRCVARDQRRQASVTRPISAPREKLQELGGGADGQDHHAHRRRRAGLPASSICTIATDAGFVSGP